MPPKRVRPESSASPPPAEKRRPNGHPASPHVEHQPPDGAAGQVSKKVDLGCVSVHSSEEEGTGVAVAPANIKEEAPCEPILVELASVNPATGALKSDPALTASGNVKKKVEEYVYVYDSDEEADIARGKGPVASLAQEDQKAGSTELALVEVTEERLLGVHDYFKAHTRKINQLLQGPVGEDLIKLSEVPEDAGWFGQPCLATVDGAPLVLVVFGSLHFVNLQFARIMLPSFSVVVELVREVDRDALQRIFDCAEPRHKEAAGRIQAFRAGPDEETRLLNVYDCTASTDPNDEGRPCGVNELLSGDIVRLILRCEKDVDEDNGRVSVDFKLRKLDLVFALPRRGDITN